MEIAFPWVISATSLTIQMVSALPVAMDQLLIQTTDAYIAFHAEKDNTVLLTERAQKLGAIVETMTLKPASAWLVLPILNLMMEVPAAMLLIIC